ncbi:hypothetical protein F4861DRAFT_547082 [Xylaria intraflava]|nr:hypothetical protein F4861DRAFT_547082 [Xylaria intraflava]
MVKRPASGKNAVSNPSSSRTKGGSATPERNSAHGGGPDLRESDVCEKSSNKACAGRAQDISSGRALAKNTDSMEVNKVMIASARSGNDRDDPEVARRLTPEEYIAYKKEVAIEKVMAAFQRWLDKKLAIISYTFEASEACEASDETGTTTNSHGSGGEEKMPGRGNSRQKRQFSDDDPDELSGGGDENGRDGGGNKRARKDTEPEELALACPFFKHNPEACWKGCCKNGGWKSIHRLKEHLYRVHLLPKHRCPRCNLCFDGDKELQEHLRADERCEKSDVAPEEGIDQDTERKLRERKKHKSGQTETQRWNDIYVLLFPGVERNAIPSPHPDHNRGVTHPASGEEQKRHYKRVERRIRKVLPVLVRQRVARRFDHVGAEVLKGFNDIVHSSLADFFKNNMPQDGGASSASPSVASRETTPGLVAIEEPLVRPLDRADEPEMDLTAFLDHDLGQYGDFNYLYDINWDFDPSNFTGEYGVNGMSLDSGYRSMGSATGSQ